MAPADAGRVTGLDYGAKSEDRLINEHETAARLGLAVATLRRWRWARRGPRWVRIGAAVRYAPSDLLAFVEAGRQETSPDSARNQTDPTPQRPRE